MKSEAEPARPAPAETGSTDESAIEGSLDLQSILLSWIAGLMIAGAAWLLASLLVPIVVALTLAIVMSPLAERLERWGLGRVGAALVCLALATTALIGTGSLVAYQAGTILQNSDQYLDRISQLLGRMTGALGADQILESIEETPTAETPTAEPAVRGHATDHTGEKPPAAAGPDGPASTPGAGAPHRAAFWRRTLGSSLRLLGGWLASGIGGFVGVIGSAVICLSFLYYFLETRSEWIDRVVRILRSRGKRPRRDSLERVKHAISIYGASVVMISIAGMVVTGITGWLLGIPHAFVWGILFGLMEFIPYFGPMVGGTMMTLVSLTAGEGEIWRAVVMLGVILAWLTLEGYVITPMIYGRAVRFDPVTVLVAVLFFGWLWGPLGMVTALPMMVLLRELVGMTPETPALDVLMEPES